MANDEPMLSLNNSSITGDEPTLGGASKLHRQAEFTIYGIPVTSKESWQLAVTYAIERLKIKDEIDLVAVFYNTHSLDGVHRLDTLDVQNSLKHIGFSTVEAMEMAIAGWERYVGGKND